MRVPARGDAIAAALALVALALASVATGTKIVRIPSGVTIQSRSLVFHGKVTSPNPGCVEKRTVKLKRVVSGGRDQVIGADTTDRHGRWRIVPQGSAGISLARFYARVRRHSEGAAGTLYVCRAARSRVVGAGI